MALQLDLNAFCLARLAVASCKAGKRVKQQQPRGKRCFHGAPHVVQASDSDRTIPESESERIFDTRSLEVHKSPLIKALKVKKITIHPNSRFPKIASSDCMHLQGILRLLDGRSFGK